jgi:hypothetical protein
LEREEIKHVARLPFHIVKLHPHPDVQREISLRRGEPETVIPFGRRRQAGGKRIGFRQKNGGRLSGDGRILPLLLGRWREVIAEDFLHVALGQAGGSGGQRDRLLRTGYWAIASQGQAKGEADGEFMSFHGEIPSSDDFGKTENPFLRQPFFPTGNKG